MSHAGVAEDNDYIYSIAALRGRINRECIQGRGVQVHGISNVKVRLAREAASTAKRRMVVEGNERCGSTFSLASEETSVERQLGQRKNWKGKVIHGMGR